MPQNYHPHLPLTLVYDIGFLNALKRRTYYAIKRDYEKMWLKFDGLINIKIVFWFCLSRYVYIPLSSLPIENIYMYSMNI